MIPTLAVLTLSVGALLPAACNPAPPSLTPCEGVEVYVNGFDTSLGCDVVPPQILTVVVEHSAPWSPVQTDTFYYHCLNSGGTVTDATGDAWTCSAIDY